jgi:DNA topoisomerase-1
MATKRTAEAAAGEGNGAVKKRGTRSAVAKSGGVPARNLVIVESPTKARTVTGILGRDYDVLASVGHVRDLPKSKLGVSVDQGFAPQYVIPTDKRKVVGEIKNAARGAEMVYLATDPDREGEAISWHIVEAADLGALPLRRVVFHEITPEGVREAFQHPREIDMRLVDAQQARRVLDRLVGYEISPILWKKVRGGLSAGRVQSVALRMVVEREREITAFVPQEYWSIEADLEKPGSPPPFRSVFVGLKGKKKLELQSAVEVEELLAALRRAGYRVAEVKRGEQIRRPAPPFTTSTLQQEASRRLGFAARRTMQVAQRLYEGIRIPGEGQVGLITYMRTDSVTIAESARQEMRRYIAGRFGADFVPSQPRSYATRSKNAQEAHEAIRPTSVFRDPDTVAPYLAPEQLRLYTLIWQRAVASQMADAVYDTISVNVDAVDGATTYVLRANRSRLRFPGFRQVYVEGTDEREEEDDSRALPDLTAGDPLRALEFFPEQHFTEPPPRFTEASLVKALEENGIGRPSTYAAIISTLLDRNYVLKEQNRLKPEELGVVVNDLLVEQFPSVFDIGFTAELEEHLDEISRGERPWAPVIQDFYQPLKELLSKAAEAPKVQEETDEVCDLCGRPMVKKWGRFGQFLSCTGYPECKGTKQIGGEEEGPQLSDEKCDECGSEMLIKRGRYGKFLACSRYPDCKGTKQIAVKLGIACPKDGGDIVEKRTRTRRTFYGCANYPTCDFTSWQRPLSDPCPNCGGLITVAGRGGAKCTACDWKGKAPGTGARELTGATA